MRACEAGVGACTERAGVRGTRGERDEGGKEEEGGRSCGPTKHTEVQMRISRTGSDRNLWKEITKVSLQDEACAREAMLLAWAVSCMFTSISLVLKGTVLSVGLPAIFWTHWVPHACAPCACKQAMDIL